VLFLSNPEYYTIYERLYFAPLKFLTKTADSIITVSDEEKKRLIEFGFSHIDSKVTVAHHGVDPSFLPIEHHDPAIVHRVKSKYGLPDRFLLYVGRLNLRKNLDNLLRAVPLLNDKTIPLVIVGADDWKKSNHRVIIRKLGIQDRIIFTGAIFEDLHRVYALAEVFCFPSYAESFGLPPLEAMASGVPVVVSNTTSLPEVCGDAAEYVNPNKPGEMALAIDKLLSNSQLHAERRKLGLLQAKKFTWEKAADIVIRTIEGSVNQK